MNSSVVKNMRALDPEHVPETIHHREGALAELRSGLKPIADGFGPENVAMFGPSGAGKTTCAKYIVSALAESVPALDWGYADALANSSRRDVFYQLARDLGHVYSKDGRATSEFLEDLRMRDHPTVLIVDEVSFLEEPIRTLVPLYRSPNVGLVTVTLSENDWLAGLDQRVAKHARSSMSVGLDAYSVDELRDIVEHRIRVGLEPEIVDDDATATIAMLAEGDARLAIALLAAAAKSIRNGEAERITAALIEEREPDARSVVKKRYRAALDTHQRLLYTIVEDAGEIRGEDLHQRFLDRVGESSPPAKRTRNRLLEALRNYGLIELEGEGRGATYLVPGE